MNSSTSLKIRAVDVFSTEQRPSSKNSSSEKAPKRASNSIRRTPPPNNHRLTGRSDDKTPLKAPPPSIICGTSVNCENTTEKQELGKETLEGRDDQEEALRALEAYAAFQITLLQHVADDPTFYDSSMQPLSPTSSRITRFDSSRSPETSNLGSGPSSV